jgi:hypothetical protein
VNHHTTVPPVRPPAGRAPTGWDPEAGGGGDDTFGDASVHGGRRPNAGAFPGAHGRPGDVCSSANGPAGRGTVIEAPASSR